MIRPSSVRCVFATLAVEQRTAQFGLERLDRARQRWLADIAALGRAREIERVRNREEIADLLHFHRDIPVRYGA